MKRSVIPHRPKFWRSALGSLALLGLSATSLPASAQFYGPPIMGEQAVVRQLRQQGFRQLTPPTLNGVVYYLDGIDPRGQPVCIIARAADARILALHPQPAGRWTRIDPEDEDDGWSERRWRRHDSRRHDPDSRDARRWEDEPYRERHSRVPDNVWRDEDWFDRRRRGQPDPWRDAPRSPLPDVDGGVTERQAPPAPRAPERVIVTPLPPPAAAARDPDLPVPTLKNPTVVKRSPTAIPRDPGDPATRPPAKQPAQKKIGTEAAKAGPDVGTRQNPRVIELAPTSPKPPAAATPPAPAPAPKAAVAPKRTAPDAAPAQSLPPPAVLEAAPQAAPRVETPTVPPAPLE